VFPPAQGKFLFKGSHVVHLSFCSQGSSCSPQGVAHWAHCTMHSSCEDYSFPSPTEGTGAPVLWLEGEHSFPTWSHWEQRSGVQSLQELWSGECRPANHFSHSLVLLSLWI
jgi:hypothetical protein